MGKQFTVADVYLFTMRTRSDRSKRRAINFRSIVRINNNSALSGSRTSPSL